MCSGRQPWRGHRQDAAFRQKIDDTKEEINAIMPKMLDLKKKTKSVQATKQVQAQQARGRLRVQSTNKVAEYQSME